MHDWLDPFFDEEVASICDLCPYALKSMDTQVTVSRTTELAEILQLMPWEDLCYLGTSPAEVVQLMNAWLSQEPNLKPHLDRGAKDFPLVHLVAQLRYMLALKRSLKLWRLAATSGAIGVGDFEAWAEVGEPVEPESPDSDADSTHQIFPVSPRGQFPTRPTGAEEAAELSLARREVALRKRPPSNLILLSQACNTSLHSRRSSMINEVIRKFGKAEITFEPEPDGISGSSTGGGETSELCCIGKR